MRDCLDTLLESDHLKPLSCRTAIARIDTERRIFLASSETFDRDPTATSRVLPSAENSRSRVQ
jgi:hypothetical protein